MRLRQRSLSRHFSSAENLLAEARSSTKASAEPRSRTPVSRYLPYDTPAWLVHPALPLLLFVFALGIWALVQHIYHDCAFVGPDSGWCLRQQHGPNVNLSRGQVSESWLPNWREDGRCGPGFPALNGHSISICNPFSKEYCCSRWGWCGSGGEYCVHAAAKPYNETQGLAFVVKDFVAKATGSGDIYQQGWREASADKAAAFEKWDKFQNAARRKFGLQSGEHLQWHIGAAVAQQFGKFRRRLPHPSAGVEIGQDQVNDLLGRNDRRMQEWGSSRKLDAAVSGDTVHSVRPSALPGLLSAIKQAAGSSLQLDHWADPAGEAELEAGQEGRMMEEEEGKKPPASPRPKAGVASLGWFPHSWDSIPHEVVNGSEPPPLKVVGEGSGAWNRGDRMGREDRWDELYAERDRTPKRGDRPYCSFQRCNPWRWIHFHNTVVRNKTDRMLREAESGQGTQDPRPAGEEGLAGYLGRSRLATFGGKAPSRRDKSEILVIYHNFERLGTCIDDEDVQVPRHNILYFIRTAVREDDGVDYIFNFGGRIDQDMLDLIPPYRNVRVRFIDSTTLHSDTCTFQQTLLEQGHAIFHQYRYFFLINNGMRGPFVSASMQPGNVHWTQPFTSRLNNETKLVGITISCEVKTHVQGPFLATDRVGIQYILDLWGGCWNDHWDDIVHAEIGLTQSIMEDGYNVASMQHEYEGLDFRLEPSKLSCRGKLNPSVCCGMEDPLQLHWVKYGGAVMRIGGQSPYLIRAVENLTDMTLGLTPPLVPSSRWQLPSEEWFEQRDAALKDVTRRNTLWRLSSRLFHRVFSLSRTGNQLAGKQSAASARYLTLLSEDEGHKQFRYQLHPHMSGFESDDTLTADTANATSSSSGKRGADDGRDSDHRPAREAERELKQVEGEGMSEGGLSTHTRSLGHAPRSSHPLPGPQDAQPRSLGTLPRPLDTLKGPWETRFAASAKAWGSDRPREGASGANPMLADSNADNAVGSATDPSAHADVSLVNETAAQNSTDEVARVAGSGGAYETENVSPPLPDMQARSFWRATFAQTQSALSAITASTAASATLSANRVAALHAIGRKGSAQLNEMQNKLVLNAADLPAEDPDEESIPVPARSKPSEMEPALETENLQDSPITQGVVGASSGEFVPLDGGSMRPTLASRAFGRAHPSPQEKWTWAQYMAAFSHLSSPSPDPQFGFHGDDDDDDGIDSSPGLF